MNGEFGILEIENKWDFFLQWNVLLDAIMVGNQNVIKLIKVLDFQYFIFLFTLYLYYKSLI